MGTHVTYHITYHVRAAEEGAAKKPRKRRRVEDLCSISDSELTETEIRQKMRRIKVY